MLRDHDDAPSPRSTHAGPSVTARTRRRLRIGVIGGVERTAPVYERLGAAAGHIVEYHGGHLGVRSRVALAGLLGRVDVLVLIMRVNGHGAAHLVRRAAQERGVPVIIVANLGATRFAELVAELAEGTR